MLLDFVVGCDGQAIRMSFLMYGVGRCRDLFLHPSRQPPLAFLYLQSRLNRGEIKFPYEGLISLSRLDCRVMAVFRNTFFRGPSLNAAKATHKAPSPVLSLVAMNQHRMIPLIKHGQ